MNKKESPETMKNYQKQETITVPTDEYQKNKQSPEPKTKTNRQQTRNKKITRNSTTSETAPITMAELFDSELSIRSTSPAGACSMGAATSVSSDATSSTSIAGGLGIGVAFFALVEQSAEAYSGATSDSGDAKATAIAINTSTITIGDFPGFS